MPNWCLFEIHAVGLKCNIDYFINTLNSGYDYSNDNPCNFMNHVFRTHVDCYDDDDINGDIKHVMISGECAWSVYSCMIDTGPISYYASCKTSYPEKFKGITLQELSKKYNLIIEVWSEEDGFAFREHYKIVYGNFVIDDCINVNTYYIDDYNTYKDFVSEYGNSPVTEEMFNYYKNIGDYYINYPSDRETGYLQFSDTATNSKCNYLCRFEMCKETDK